MKRFLAACINHYRYLAGNDLSGCIPDGRTAVEHLRRLYDFDKLVVLPDADRESILDALRDAVRDLEDGDEFVFLYSGHGTQVIDGRERDGLAECICPADTRMDRDDELIRLHEIHAILERLRPGANATILMDCCHGEDADKAFRRQPATRRYLPRVIGAPRPCPSTPNRDWPYVWITACQSNETAADLGTNGALSWAFWNAVAKAVRAPATELLLAVRELLARGGFEQHPVLHGHPDLLARPIFGGTA